MANFPVLIVQQILLRQIEVITKCCTKTTSVQFGEFEVYITIFTAMVHFMTFVLAANPTMRIFFSKQLHFNSTLLSYVKRDFHAVLLQSCQPELIWKHAASVGAVGELIVLMKAAPLVDAGATQDQGKTLQVLLDAAQGLVCGNLETGYIIGMRP